MTAPPRPLTRHSRRLGRLCLDVLAQLSSAALLIGSLALFLAGAIVGVAVIDRLGGAGWFMYVVVISTYALVFGPMIASAVTMHQRGSRRHRAMVARRIAEQREFFGIDTRAREGDASRRQS